jgi:uncharacterized protein YcbX
MLLASIHTYPIKSCRGQDHACAPVRPWGLAGDRRWMIVDDDGVGVTQRETTALVRLRPAVRPGGLVLRATGRPDLDVPEPDGDRPVDVRVFNNRLRVPALPAGGAADQWLGELLDRKVRLVWLARPTRHQHVDGGRPDPGDQVSFADAYPLLLANAASLDALNGWLADSGSTEGPLPMTRFRPNLVIGGAEPWAEDDWADRRLRIGSAIFRVADGCDRCVVTTTDQETGRRGKEPLRVLAARRKFGRDLLFGLNLVPAGPVDGGTPERSGTGDDAADDFGTIGVGDSVELLT